jgi:AraC-like DNA-binding protein
MSEFASAAMVRVLSQGMKALGLSTDPLQNHRTGKESAWVGLDEKRRTVMWAVAQAGHACLPLLGRGLHTLSHEPTHAALVAARSPEDLLMRWQRLERYIHSSHRVAYSLPDARSESNSNSVLLLHQPRAGHAGPLPEESLVVLGVLAALLEAVGASGVEVLMGTVRVYPQADMAKLQALVKRGNTHTWTMRWQAFAASAPQVSSPPLKDTLPQELNLPDWPPLAQQAAALILQDLMHPPSLAQAATALGWSARSIQRTLAGSGLSHTRLIAQCRVLAASRYLLQSSLPLAEVGFLCGFSDQPHFTRAFRMQVGVTPARYRQEFGAV